jgi:hypothetical protein
MGLLTGKADVVSGMPQYSSQGENWIQWHKDLKSNFGKKIANSLWLKAWRIRGNSTSNTPDLRSYMTKQGVTISKSAWDSVVDTGIGVTDAIGSIFQMSATASILIGVVVVGGLGYVIYKIMKDPSKASTVIALATPQGRALSMANSVSGGLKK